MIGKKQLDLLLVNAGNRKRTYQSLGAALAAIEPPIWAGLMATFMGKRGYAVEILDAAADDLPPEETVRRIAGMRPLLTAVVVYGHNPSASTQVMPSAGEICKAVKREAPDLKVLLIGGHVAALPERTLREEEADFVCGDEGLFTLLDLVEALRRDRQAEYSKVRGLW